MALKGKLRDFSLTQLLNLVHLARKTGALSIEATEGAAEIFFQDGKLVYAAIAGRPNSLADLMVQAGKLTPAQGNSLKASGRARDDKQLGLLLINSGHISKTDVTQALRKNMLDVIHTVFEWTDGSFVFDQKLTPPAGRVTIPVGLDSIVLEGGRRKEEVSDLQTELPSLDVILKFTDGPGKNLRNINLSVDEWRVISFINPRNTVATIAQYNQMSEFQVRKIVAKLLRDNLVEIVGGTPSRAPALAGVSKPVVAPAKETAGRAVVQPQPEPARPKFTEPQVEKGIISRLISRIRGL